MPSNSARKWSASYLASLTPEQRASFLSKLTQQELKNLRYDWSFWARTEQRAPSGNCHTWLILAGRGAGKTRSGAEWLRACACGATPLTGGSYQRIALVAETAADARDVMVEGPSGLLAIHPSAFRLGHWIDGKLSTYALPQELDSMATATTYAPMSPYIVDPATGKLDSQYRDFFQGIEFIQGGPIGGVSLDPTPTEAANAINALLGVLRSQKRLST